MIAHVHHLLAQMTFSILHRLPCEIPDQRPNLQEIQPDLQPLEVLFDTSKLLNEEFVTFLEIFLLVSADTLPGTTFEFSVS